VKFIQLFDYSERCDTAFIDNDKKTPLTFSKSLIHFDVLIIVFLEQNDISIL